MGRLRTLLLLSLTISLLAPATGVAQTCSYNGLNGSCSVNVATSLTINRLLRLTINDSSTTVPTPTVADYDSPTGQDFSALSVTVKANDTWALSIRGTTATWTGSGGARANKPVGDLHWSITGGAPFTTVTTTNAQMRTGPRGAATVTNVFYRVIWAYALDTPGTYRMTVVYTLTAP